MKNFLSDIKTLYALWQTEQARSIACLFYILDNKSFCFVNGRDICLVTGYLAWEDLAPPVCLVITVANLMHLHDK
jgi:hypothetical protein